MPSPPSFWGPDQPRHESVVPSVSSSEMTLPASTSESPAPLLATLAHRLRPQTRRYDKRLCNWTNPLRSSARLRAWAFVANSRTARSETRWLAWPASKAVRTSWPSWRRASTLGSSHTPRRDASVSVSAQLRGGRGEPRPRLSVGRALPYHSLGAPLRAGGHSLPRTDGCPEGAPLLERSHQPSPVSKRPSGDLCGLNHELRRMSLSSLFTSSSV